MRFRPFARFIALLALVLASVLVVACGAAAPSPARTATPEVSAPPAGPLVTLEVRGGECPEGACGGTTAVERDGRVHVTAPAPSEIGAVPQDVLDALIVEIDQADFEALASRPFTGECPVNVDGQEFIYSFVTAGGEHRLASCEVEIDPEDPLFVAVNAAIAAAGG
jgi:hypothetical protein